jgi:hypothetical protein
MTTPDILEYIRAALATNEPLTPAHVEQTIERVRQTFGGDTEYIRARDPRATPTRRTIQRRMRMA